MRLLKLGPLGDDEFNFKSPIQCMPSNHTNHTSTALLPNNSVPFGIHLTSCHMPQHDT